MEGQASDHDVVADVGGFVLVRGCASDAAARGLQHQREDVAGDEDERVGAGRDAGVCGAEGVDDAAEAEVEACGEEGGGDGEADDLEEEGVLVVVEEISKGVVLGEKMRWGWRGFWWAYLVERVVVAHHSADVAEDFEDFS